MVTMGTVRIPVIGGLIKKLQALQFVLLFVAIS
jgi:hypothetical protein